MARRRAHPHEPPTRRALILLPLVWSAVALGIGVAIGALRQGLAAWSACVEATVRAAATASFTAPQTPPRGCFARPADRQGSLWDGSASVRFLASRGVALRRHLAARPPFLADRAFALMGYAFVEGAVRDGRLREGHRVSFSPAAREALRRAVGSGKGARALRAGKE